MEENLAVKESAKTQTRPNTANNGAQTMPEKESIGVQMEEPVVEQDK